MATQEDINQCVLQAHGNLDEVRKLVDADPELVLGNAEWTETPLQAASHMGRKDIAEYLLEQGAELDFFAAAMLGRSDDVARFIAADQSLPQSAGVHGIPSLYFPALTGQIAIVETLLEGGAEVNAGEGGNTPLHGAAAGRRTQMAQWLLARGANRSAVNYDGKTPSEVATAMGSEELAALLAPVPVPAG